MRNTLSGLGHDYDDVSRTGRAKRRFPNLLYRRFPNLRMHWDSTPTRLRALPTWKSAIQQTWKSMRVKLRRVKEGHCEFERLKGRSGCACERWHGWFCLRLGSRERSTTDQTDSPKWWGGTFGVLCAR